MVPLLTGGPGSLVRRYVENQVARREFMENLERRLDNGEEIDWFNQPESHGSSVTREGSVDERRLDRRTVQSERVKECLEDLHDFEGASDWLLQVTVKQHDGKDDKVGEQRYVDEQVEDREQREALKALQLACSGRKAR